MIAKRVGTKLHMKTLMVICVQLVCQTHGLRDKGFSRKHRTEFTASVAYQMGALQHCPGQLSPNMYRPLFRSALKSLLSYWKRELMMNSLCSL